MRPLFLLPEHFLLLERMIIVKLYETSEPVNLGYGTQRGRFPVSWFVVANLEVTNYPAPAESRTDASAFAADYNAVSNAVGVQVLDGRVVVHVVGDDRVSFFHGMCSADVKGSAPGSVLAALILT